MEPFKLKSAIISLITATLAMCTILTVVWMYAIDAKEAWSGWVQAIGSIAAIMAGWVVVLWQQGKSDDAKREERRIFAVAFGIQLLPQLRKLRQNLEFTIKVIGKAVDETDDPNAKVDYDDDQGSYDNIKFVRENWSTLAQLEGETVRALVSASSFYEIAHSMYDPEQDVDEAFTAPDGTHWFTITLRNRERALEHRGAFKLALRQVDIAIDSLSIAQFGEPELVIEIPARNADTSEGRG